MATITICSDFGAKKNKIWHCFQCFPIYFPWNHPHTTLQICKVEGPAQAHHAESLDSNPSHLTVWQSSSYILSYLGWCHSAELAYMTPPEFKLEARSVKRQELRDSILFLKWQQLFPVSQGSTRCWGHLQGGQKWQRTRWNLCYLTFLALFLNTGSKCMAYNPGTPSLLKLFWTTQCSFLPHSSFPWPHSIACGIFSF